MKLREEGHKTTYEKEMDNGERTEDEDKTAVVVSTVTVPTVISESVPQGTDQQPLKRRKGLPRKTSQIKKPQLQTNSIPDVGPLQMNIPSFQQRKKSGSEQIAADCETFFKKLKTQKVNIKQEGGEELVKATDSLLVQNHVAPQECLQLLKQEAMPKAIDTMRNNPYENLENQNDTSNIKEVEVKKETVSAPDTHCPSELHATQCETLNLQCLEDETGEISSRTTLVAEHVSRKRKSEEVERVLFRTETSGAVIKPKKKKIKHSFAEEQRQNATVMSVIHQESLICNQDGQDGHLQLSQKCNIRKERKKAALCPSGIDLRRYSRACKVKSDFTNRLKDHFAHKLVQAPSASLKNQFTSTEILSAPLQALGGSIQCEEPPRRRGRPPKNKLKILKGNIKQEGVEEVQLTDCLLVQHHVAPEEYQHVLKQENMPKAADTTRNHLYDIWENQNKESNIKEVNLKMDTVSSSDTHSASESHSTPCVTLNPQSLQDKMGDFASRTTMAADHVSMKRNSEEVVKLKHKISHRYQKKTKLLVFAKGQRKNYAEISAVQQQESLSCNQDVPLKFSQKSNKRKGREKAALSLSVIPLRRYSRACKVTPFFTDDKLEDRFAHTFVRCPSEVTNITKINNSSSLQAQDSSIQYEEPPRRRGRPPKNKLKSKKVNIKQEIGEEPQVTDSSLVQHHGAPLECLEVLKQEELSFPLWTTGIAQSRPSVPEHLKRIFKEELGVGEEAFNRHTAIESVIQLKRKKGRPFKKETLLKMAKELAYIQERRSSTIELSTFTQDVAAHPHKCEAMKGQDEKKKALCSPVTNLRQYSRACKVTPSFTVDRMNDPLAQAILPSFSDPPFPCHIPENKLSTSSKVMSVSTQGPENPFSIYPLPTSSFFENNSEKGKKNDRSNTQSLESFAEPQRTGRDGNKHSDMKGQPLYNSILEETSNEKSAGARKITDHNKEETSLSSSDDLKVQAKMQSEILRCIVQERTSDHQIISQTQNATQLQNSLNDVSGLQNEEVLALENKKEAVMQQSFNKMSATGLQDLPQQKPQLEVTGSSTSVSLNKSAVESHSLKNTTQKITGNGGLVMTKEAEKLTIGFKKLSSPMNENTAVFNTSAETLDTDIGISSAESESTDIIDTQKSKILLAKNTSSVEGLENSSKIEMCLGEVSPKFSPDNQPNLSQEKNVLGHTMEKRIVVDVTEPFILNAYSPQSSLTRIVTSEDKQKLGNLTEKFNIDVRGEKSNMQEALMKLTALPPKPQILKLLFKKRKRGKCLIECTFCGRSFRHLSAYIIHRRIHTGDKPYRCHDCGKSFAHFSILKLHKKVHKRPMHLQCPYCMSKFSERTKLLAHFQIHIQYLDHLTGESCSEVQTKHNCQLPVSNVILKDCKPFICLICRKGFRHSANLKNHMCTHKSIKLFSCKDCTRTFNQLSSLEAHKKSHWPVKPYACSICGKVFSQIKTLKDHSQTHTGENPFSCAHCGCAFNQLSSLRTHQFSRVCLTNGGGGKGEDGDTGSIEEVLVQLVTEQQVNPVGTVKFQNLNMQTETDVQPSDVSDERGSQIYNFQPISVEETACSSTFFSVCQKSQIHEQQIQPQPCLPSEVPCNQQSQSSTHQQILSLECLQTQDQACLLKTPEISRPSANLEPEIGKPVQLPTPKIQQSSDIRPTQGCATVAHHSQMNVKSSCTYHSLRHFVRQSDHLGHKPDLRRFKCQRSDRYSARLKPYMLTRVSAYRYACGLDKWNKLRLRQRIHQQKQGCLSCPYCCKRFKFAELYKEHLQEHAEQKPYACPLCPKIFTYGESLKTHQRKRHKSETGYKCNICGKHFINLKNLVRHNFLHRSANTHVYNVQKNHLKTRNCQLPEMPLEPMSAYQCRECNASFKTLELLTLHEHCHIPVDWDSLLEECVGVVSGTCVSQPCQPSQQRHTLAALPTSPPQLILPTHAHIPQYQSLYEYPHPDCLYVTKVPQNEALCSPRIQRMPSQAYKGVCGALSFVGKPNNLQETVDCAECGEVFSAISELYKHYIQHARGVI